MVPSTNTDCIHCCTSYNLSSEEPALPFYPELIREILCHARTSVRSCQILVFYNPLFFIYLPGSVICDACSLAAEGEADIQENFCRSSYGKNGCR